MAKKITYFSAADAYWKDNKHKHPELTYLTYLRLVKKYYLLTTEYLAEGNVYPVSSKQRKVSLFKYKSDLTNRVDWLASWKKVEERTGSPVRTKMIKEDIVYRTKYAVNGFNFKPRHVGSVKNDVFGFWHISLAPKVAYIHCCEYFKANPNALDKLIDSANVTIFNKLIEK